MKANRPVYSFMISAVFLFIALFGIQAAGAGFKTVDVGTSTGGERTKVGSYYFYGAFQGDDWYLYKSTSKTGKGTALTRLYPWTSALKIKTDGSTVIYPSFNFDRRKTFISGIKVDGSGHVTYTSFATKGYFELAKVYKNHCYFPYFAGNGLYCLDLKTKTKTRILKGTDFQTFENPDTRYLYIAVPKTTSVVVKAINCSSNETMGSYSLSHKKGYTLTGGKATTKYFYLTTINGAKTQGNIFRMPVSGSSKPVSIAAIKSPVKGAKFEDLHVINNSYAVYSVYKETEDDYISYHYKYTFSTKASKKITLSSYYNALDNALRQ